MKARFFLLALVSTIISAEAHIVPGSAHSFQAGFAHPWHGYDHLLAMVAVGLWAAQQQGKARWMIPALFVSGVFFGAVLGLAGILLGFVEAGIAISLLAFGGLVWREVKMTLIPSLLLTGCFALFHGYAHGAEMPATMSSAGYFGGFLLATALLHAAGLIMGTVCLRFGQMRVLRFAGLATLAGVVFCL